jgi:hypothetical protein
LGANAVGGERPRGTTGLTGSTSCRHTGTGDDQSRGGRMSPDLRRRLVGANLLQADTDPSWEPRSSPSVPAGARRRIAQVTEGWSPGWRRTGDDGCGAGIGRLGGIWVMEEILVGELASPSGCAQGDGEGDDAALQPRGDGERAPFSFLDRVVEGTDLDSTRITGQANMLGWRICKTLQMTGSLMPKGQPFEGIT